MIPLISVQLLAGVKAADIPPPIRPAIEPVAIVRLSDFAWPEKLAANPAARLLGFAGRDFSGRLSGLNAATPSLLNWPRALEKSGALDFWYALFPDGLDLAGAVGGDWPDDGGTGQTAGDFAAWLKSVLFDPGLMPILVGSPAPGVSRRLLARDAAALKLILPEEGAARSDSGAGWRESISAFFRRRPEGLAAWLNPRPLLGLASLTSGIDGRGSLAAAGMRLPDSLELELAPDEFDFGLKIKLNRLLPEPIGQTLAPGLAVRHGRDAERTRVTISQPAALFPSLGLGGNPLSAAGLDLRAMIPEHLGLTLWLDGEDVPRWFAVGTFSAGDAFRRHFRRLLAWLDVLAASPGSGLSLSPAGAGSGADWRRLERAGFSLVIGLAETRDGVPLFLAAGRAEDCPEPDEFSLEPGTAAPGLTWELRLDGKERQTLEKLAGAWRDKKLTRLEARDLDNWSRLLESGESGSLDFSGTSLSLSSRNGVSLLAIIWRLMK
jgi:hypothetical protein